MTIEKFLNLSPLPKINFALFFQKSKPKNLYWKYSNKSDYTFPYESNLEKQNYISLFQKENNIPENKSLYIKKKNPLYLLKYSPDSKDYVN